MTYKHFENDERKQYLLDYHNNYNKQYSKLSNSMKKSKLLYDYKRRYDIPPDILKKYGNNIPYLFKLQKLLGDIQPNVLKDFLTTTNNFDFKAKTN